MIVGTRTGKGTGKGKGLRSEVHIKQLEKSSVTLSGPDSPGSVQRVFLDSVSLPRERGRRSVFQSRGEDDLPSRCSSRNWTNLAEAAMRLVRFRSPWPSSGKRTYSTGTPLPFTASTNSSLSARGTRGSLAPWITNRGFCDVAGVKEWRDTVESFLVRSGITHLCVHVRAEGVIPGRQAVDGSHPVGHSTDVDSDIEDVGFKRQGGSHHVPAVAGTNDADPRTIDPIQSLQVFPCLNTVTQIDLSMPLVIQVMEGLTIASRASVVHGQDGVTVIDQMLEDRPIPLSALATGSAVHPDERPALCWRSSRRVDERVARGFRARQSSHSAPLQIPQDALG